MRETESGDGAASGESREKRRTRPSSYDPERHPRLVRWMARCGLTNAEIARSPEFGISERTFRTWQIEHPEILQSLKEGRDLADDRVEDSLYKRALGYEYEETETTAGADGSRRIKKTKKAVAPDVTACIFWLKNRQPERWRDVRQVEQTGAGGGPIRVKTEGGPDLSRLSDDELEEYARLSGKVYGAAGPDEGASGREDDPAA